MKKKVILALGPLICLLFFFSPFQFISPEADKVLGIALWMILWWITEVVSISVTALIPLTFYPLLGIMPIKEVAVNYGHPIIFLFFGGFVLALALEKVNLHRRVALSIIKLTGTSPNKIILGFMLATAFLSMWISNTATTVVMLPIAYSVIELLIDDADGFTKNDRNFALSIMLGIAYSANVGGIATLIGTPPNIVLAGFMENEYNYSISFVKWMIVGIPFAVIMLFFIYYVLTKVMYPNRLASFEKSKEIINSEMEKLGKISRSEVIVLIIFILAILFWIGKNYLNSLFPNLALSDTTISMVAAFACFTATHNSTSILSWKDTERLPWGILLLFGGGLALASALSNVGIIAMIGEVVSANKTFSILLICSILIAVMLFMTELMSNVALVAIFAPMVAGVAVGLNIDLLHILIPVTMASSCAFMLPMATPPNAIVFASGHVKVAQMARAGFLLNILSIVLLVLFFQFIIPLVFHF
ncbi:sodium-dependent dicarboxylate transporter SdcS [Kordia sp. SMS9]|uniref:SLC13 family permease n=1 Tax=Kordia sp. SMS9 TaxID=2282170 RepID=UPI000E0E05FB|nr:DASS family sodium-coupled anion symporter [Kordia sp. SMS9]AXG70767.1 sodium-dependent dicarboxylate transporter SdcS [Kordia sp. SMS9]